MDREEQDQQQQQQDRLEGWMMPRAGELSQAALAGMVCFARGERKVFNALCLRILHGRGFRQIGRELGVADTTVREWCRGYTNAARDYCQLAGITETEFASGSQRQASRGGAESAEEAGGQGREAAAAA